MASERTIRRQLLCFFWGCTLLVLPFFTLSQHYDFSQQILQHAQERFDPGTVELAMAWQTMMRSAGGMDEKARLKRVNNFFNRHILFQDDMITWQKKDYWATPLETMSKRAGDCEDFAIAKYATLKMVGISPEKLRLIYVRAQRGGSGSGINQAHMVLGYYSSPQSDPLILDNLVSDIRPAAQRRDLFPVFSFNSEDLWVTTSGGRNTRAADATTRLSPWRDVMERMRREGWQ